MAQSTEDVDPTAGVRSCQHIPRRMESHDALDGRHEAILSDLDLRRLLIAAIAGAVKVNLFLQSTGTIM